MNLGCIFIVQIEIIFLNKKIIYNLKMKLYFDFKLSKFLLKVINQLEIDCLN